MVVFSVNGTTPNIHGNVNVVTTSMPGESRAVKIWCGTATVSGGNWSVDYTSAGFTQVKNIQLTVQSSISTEADIALSAMIATSSATAASGKAYRITSAGALVAMQQTAAVNGTIVNVMVIGH